MSSVFAKQQYFSVSKHDRWYQTPRAVEETQPQDLPIQSGVWRQLLSANDPIHRHQEKTRNLLWETWREDSSSWLFRNLHDSWRTKTRGSWWSEWRWRVLDWIQKSENERGEWRICKNKNEAAECNHIKNTLAPLQVQQSTNSFWWC